jgi:hypothetical protein
VTTLPPCRVMSSSFIFLLDMTTFSTWGIYCTVIGGALCRHCRNRKWGRSMSSRHCVATVFSCPKVLWIRIHRIRIQIRIRILPFQVNPDPCDGFFAINVGTFGYFMEGNSVTPPYDMKQSRDLNFDKSHPLILNYHEKVFGYVPQ